MKKAVTVFVVLTPVAIAIWALAFCLSGIVGGNMSHFIPYVRDMFAAITTLWEKPFFDSNKIFADAFIGLMLVGLLLYIIIPAARRRKGYIWHTILVLFATFPAVITFVNQNYYTEATGAFAESAGEKIAAYFTIGAAGLVTLLMFVTFLLSMIDCFAHSGRKSGKKVISVDDFGVEAEIAPMMTENGLTNKAIPASEPLDIKPDNDVMQDIRTVVQEELRNMHSRLQVRQDVKETLIEMNGKERLCPPETPLIPKPIEVKTEATPEVKKAEKCNENPVKIVIMMNGETKKCEEVVSTKEPIILPMVEKSVVEDETVDILEEPLVEQTPKFIEEPLVEVVPLDEPPTEEPEVEGQEEVAEEEPEPVPMDEPAIEEEVEEEPELEVVEETHKEPVIEEVVEEVPLEEPDRVEEDAEEEPEEPQEPVILEEPEVEQVVEEVPLEDEPEPEVVAMVESAPVEEAPVQEVVEETTEEVVEETIEEEPAMEVTPEEEVEAEPAPTVEEEKEETLTFEEEPEGLVTVTQPEFEEEPEPEANEKIEEFVTTPVVEEAIKPTYERISFMDRMTNTDPVMKEHYNLLKNDILAYGVKSRVSNSGDAFRLHTKTYVKITIAGKSLKLYFALDPEDYKDTKLPIQNAGNKGIYQEIPLVFKVKSDLSMKRAYELIADAMAKDGLEKGEVGTVDYVEALKDEIATQDSED